MVMTYILDFEHLNRRLNMTKSGIMKCCICFAGGAITLLLVLILLFLIDTSGGKNIQLTDARYFGDVKIWTEKASDEAIRQHNLGKTLYMCKSGKVFLVMQTDASSRNVDGLCLLDREGNIILTVSADTETGQWEWLIYRDGREEPILPVEVFIDLNVDGRFDSKYTVDNAGTMTDRCIYTEGTWIKVEERNENGVISEGKRYIFDVNNGWYHE